MECDAIGYVLILIQRAAIEQVCAHKGRPEKRVRSGISTPQTGYNYQILLIYVL